LSWNNHINNIEASANQAQGMLRRNIKKAPQHTKAVILQQNLVFFGSDLPVDGTIISK
jgi:hypothetical protein